MEGKIVAKKVLNFTTLFILISVFTGFFLFWKIEKDKIEIQRILEYKNQPIILMFVGDIMLDRGVEYMVEKEGNGDFKFPFLKIAKYLKQADILFGNLESQISDRGKNIAIINSFRANPEAIEGLVFAGFDVISVANNHIYDYADAAMENSFKRLKEVGIAYVGAGFNKKEAHSGIIKKVKGVKIGFLAYTNLAAEYWLAKDEKSGITTLSEKELVEDIKKIKEKTDLVVVSFHFGEEYQLQPNQYQRNLAHLAIDNGVDLVVGHHPHVIQSIEEYKDGFIAYSLGNFIFDQGFSEKTMEGLLLNVLVLNKKIEAVNPIKIKINKFFQPELK